MKTLWDVPDSMGGSLSGGAVEDTSSGVITLAIMVSGHMMVMMVTVMVTVTVMVMMVTVMVTVIRLKISISGSDIHLSPYFLSQKMSTDWTDRSFWWK